MPIMTYTEAEAQWLEDVGGMQDFGIVTPDVRAYLPESFRQNYNLAMDAVPTLATTPNSGIPAYLTMMIDPEVTRILFVPNKAAVIAGEVRKGDWTSQTMLFPVVEHTGEVSSYGDYNTNGRAGANMDWPQRQSYLYQTIKEYGELELDRAGLARIGWAAEIDRSAVTVLNKFQNLTYFFGVANLQNYGLLNDPSLSAALAPSVKAAGHGNVWIYQGVITASANEIFTDIQSLFIEIINQSGGAIETSDRFVLALSPQLEVALTATNSFNVNVYDLLKKNFPNLRVETAVQYGSLTASNPQGIAAGNQVQLICESVDGQDTKYCAYNEKLRNHPIIRDLSSFKQKATQGTWGAIIRRPFAFASMIGV